MRLLLFVSAFGILISLGVLIAVIIKAKRDEPPPLDEDNEPRRRR